MPYKLKPTMTFEAQADYAVNAAGALNARSETRPLAEGWRTRKGVIRAARNAREVARDAWLEAAAEYHVARTDWHRALKQVADLVLDASNGKHTAEPYRTTVGVGAMAKVRSLGSRRAIDFGSLVLGRVGVLARAELAPATAAFQGAQAHLVATDAARRHAWEALRLHEQHRVQSLAALQTAADATEVEILKVFPGQTERVRDVLAPPRDDERRDARDDAGSTATSGASTPT